MRAFLVLFVLLIGGCVQTSYVSSPYISRIYENQECFGTCIYNLTINENGVLRYYEQTGISIDMNKEFGLDNKQITELLDAYNNFSKLDNEYYCDRSKHTERTIFIFKNITLQKKVAVQGNCNVPQLAIINDQLDRLKNQKISYENRSVFTFLNKTIVGDIKNKIGEVVDEVF